MPLNFQTPIITNSEFCRIIRNNNKSYYYTVYLSLHRNDKQTSHLNRTPRGSNLLNTAQRSKAINEITRKYLLYIYTCIKPSLHRTLRLEIAMQSPRARSSRSKQRRSMCGRTPQESYIYIALQIAFIFDILKRSFFKVSQIN